MNSRRLRSGLHSSALRSYLFADASRGLSRYPPLFATEKGINGRKTYAVDVPPGIRIVHAEMELETAYLKRTLMLLRNGPNSTYTRETIVIDRPVYQ